MMPMVSVSWLAERLGTPTLKLVDASWHMPATGRNASEEFLLRRIPGAVFFDIDAAADQSSKLPHMLPSADDFARYVSGLGIGNDDTIIIYDSIGIFSAPRAWWTFRAFGHANVHVLDGGLPAWQKSGHGLASGPAETPPPKSFQARINPDLVSSLQQVLANVTTNEAQLVDARPAGRFAGTQPEPRPGLRGGHVPGSRSLPFDHVLRDGHLRSSAELQEAFGRADIDLSRPIICACGSGVTAAILVLALAQMDRDDCPIYDGSWAEWGARDDLPIASGPIASGPISSGQLPPAWGVTRREPAIRTDRHVVSRVSASVTTWAIANDHHLYGDD